MLVSPAKLADMKARETMLEAMEICLRNGLKEEAKSLGESSRKLAERIAVHNYRQEDAVYERNRRIIRPVDSAPLPTTKDV